MFSMNRPTIWSTSGSNRLETFKVHRIEVLVPHSAGPLVIRRDSKLSKTHQTQVLVPYDGGLLVIQRESKLSKHIEYM